MQHGGFTPLFRSIAPGKNASANSRRDVRYEGRAAASIPLRDLSTQRRDIKAHVHPRLICIRVHTELDLRAFLLMTNQLMSFVLKLPWNGAIELFFNLRRVKLLNAVDGRLRLNASRDVLVCLCSPSIRYWNLYYQFFVCPDFFHPHS